MQFVSSDEVHESALNGSYLEIWRRLPDSCGPVAETWLLSADGSGRQACLLRAGDYFMFAADRPVRLGRGRVGWRACRREVRYRIQPQHGTGCR